jgi:CheY-like chemotaxis protein
MEQPGKHLLVIEDDPVLRNALALYLERKGYRIDVATDGRAALEWLARATRPDLIILDLMMLEMTGMEFRERQRYDPALATIPVIVLSAASDIARKADVMGDVVYLQKPVDHDRLMAEVERLTGSRSS